MNDEVYSATISLVTISGFICRILLVHQTTCASGMEDCGWSRLWGTTTLLCVSSMARTSLFTIILFKSGRMDGNLFMNSLILLSFWIQLWSGANNDCKYGCVRVSGVVVVEVSITSSKIWVEDGGGGVWVRLKEGGVTILNFFWLVCPYCSSSTINLWTIHQLVSFFWWHPLGSELLYHTTLHYHVLSVLGV